MTEVPDDLTRDDCILNIKSDLLGIVTGYGGDRIAAGPRMESMLDELFDYVMSERARAFTDAAKDRS